MNSYYQENQLNTTATATNNNNNVMNEYVSYSVPLSPVTTNENAQDYWMNGLISNSVPISQTTSNSDINYTEAPNPINLTSIFENNNIFSNDDFTSSSNDISLANSPETNATSDSIAHNLDEVKVKLENHSQAGLDALESAFETKSILKEQPKVKREPNTKEPTKPKRRAPRKKLTESQKKAHNKIEKRYRININAKIAGIQKIIPWVAFEKTAFETGEENETEAEVKNNTRLNKSMILEKATEYILHLQKKEAEYMAENHKLREQVIKLGGEI